MFEDAGAVDPGCFEVTICAGKMIEASRVGSWHGLRHRSPVVVVWGAPVIRFLQRDEVKAVMSGEDMTATMTHKGVFGWRRDPATVVGLSVLGL